MKKILVISNYRGLHTARPEAEIFIGLRKLGFTITIMTFSDAEYIEQFEEVGIRVIPKHPEKKYDKEFIKILTKELETNKYDILHLFNNKAIRNGIRAAKKLDINIVIYRGASANMAWWNPLNYLKFYHPRIDYVICNSEEIKKNFLAVPFRNSIKPITILKGHSIEWYLNVKKNNNRTEFGLNENSLLLVTVANNRAVKGIDILLKSLKLIPKSLNIDLLIIGEKMGNSPIPKLKKNSGIADRIHILGFRADSLNIVASCDLLICPSIGSEALTKSVIEAMSLGVVPIISDIEGNKPLVDHLINGYVFQKSNPRDLAEKITTAYKNRDRLKELSKAAITKIDQHITSENTIHKYSAFYNSI
jgi:glycosyltransferase involved in cell wall biosynthesis